MNKNKETYDEEQIFYFFFIREWFLPKLPFKVLFPMLALAGHP
jgi:hypothetical protein